MKTFYRIFSKNKYLFICLILLTTSLASYSFNISGTVKNGSGTLQFFKDGKLINATTTLNTGDVVIIYASPDTEEALEYLIVNQNTYHSAPIIETIGMSNIVVEASFKTKSVFFKETFGELNARTATVVVSDTAYSGYDNYEYAAFSANNGGTLIWNTTFGSTSYSMNATDVYLRNSSLIIGLFCNGRIFAHNVQIKFRLIPTNTPFSYISFKATLNDDTTTLPIGNVQTLPVKYIPLFSSPDVTYTHTAPYTVINIPDKGIDLTEIKTVTMLMKTLTGYSNRCRIDDITIVGDSSLTLSDVQEFYANPTQKVSLSIESNRLILKGNLLQNSFVKLYDVTGIEQMNAQIIGEEIELSTAKLNPGVYIISVVNKKEKIESLKVIIQ